MIYILLSIIALLFIILCVLLSFYFKSSSHNNILNSEIDSLRKTNEQLFEEKILFIKQIESANSKIKYQEQLIQDFDKLKSDISTSTKESLFDLATNLSKQLIDLHHKESNHSYKLSSDAIKESSKKFNSEFERLISMVGVLGKDIEQSRNNVDLIKNSLLSPQMAGSLAEITLENILTASNLRRDIDFMIQYSMTGKEGNILRPDAVLFLPANNIMIIDAKASKFFLDSSEDSDAKLIKTIQSHMKNLAHKDYRSNLRNFYQKNKKEVKNIFTVMFLPSEAAIDKILSIDNNFLNKAWDLNIFPVGPVGLMNMLSLAKFQISEEMIMYNHMQIIEEIKKILSSIEIMAKYSDRLGSSLSSLVKNYDGFVGSFNNNFLSKVKKIKVLGVGDDNNKQILKLNKINDTKDHD